VFLELAIDKMGLSTRAFHKIIKVARTIADLNNCIDINKSHLLEALSYRAMDRLLQQINV
ncbi:MAG: ATP-binding protein, partial [Moritella sp.]|nr:ATP-binding protein [Moritella sp.]